MIEFMGFIIDRETWANRPVFLVYKNKTAHHAGDNTCTHYKIKDAKNWVKNFSNEKTN
jgi:hypothetical protein